jgi:hypothetical protein
MIKIIYRGIKSNLYFSAIINNHSLKMLPKRESK